MYCNVTFQPPPWHSVHDDIRSGSRYAAHWKSPELCRPCWADTGELKRLLPHNRVECSDPVSTLQYLQCSHLSPTWVLNLLGTDERLRSADTDNALTGMASLTSPEAGFLLNSTNQFWRSGPRTRSMMAAWRYRGNHRHRVTVRGAKAEEISGWLYN